MDETEHQSLLGMSHIARHPLYRLPSIYTSSVVDTLEEAGYSRLNPVPRSGLLHSMLLDKCSSSPMPQVDGYETMGEDSFLQRRDTLEMIFMYRLIFCSFACFLLALTLTIFRFREKLLPMLPMLDPDDWLFTEDLLDSRPSFALCICYVVASFLPGGRAIRKALLPKIKQMLLTNHVERVDETDYMKILIILFASSRFGSPKSQKTLTNAEEDLLYWPMKAIVEMNRIRFKI